MKTAAPACLYNLPQFGAAPENSFSGQPAPPILYELQIFNLIERKPSESRFGDPVVRLSGPGTARPGGLFCTAIDAADHYSRFDPLGTSVCPANRPT
jgi:hypothetical protein